MSQGHLPAPGGRACRGAASHHSRVDEQETVPKEESPWVKVARKPRNKAVGKSSVNLEEIGEGAIAGPVEM